MAVPDFQSLMLPMMQIASDGKEHSLREARELLSSQFRLTDTDLEELLASGRQSKFSNRVAWAKSYLQQAGLLVSPRRGHFQISERGMDVLKSPPSRIDIKFLEQYPEFVAFRMPKETISATSSASLPIQSEVETETPEEALEAAHLRMRAGLASELLARVKAASPQFFERLGRNRWKTGDPAIRRRSPRQTGEEGCLHHDGFVLRRSRGVRRSHRSEDRPD